MQTGGSNEARPGGGGGAQGEAEVTHAGTNGTHADPTALRWHRHEKQPRATKPNDWDEMDSHSTDADCLSSPGRTGDLPTATQELERAPLLAQRDGTQMAARLPQKAEEEGTGPSWPEATPHS